MIAYSSISCYAQKVPYDTLKIDSVRFMMKSSRVELNSFIEYAVNDGSSLSKSVNSYIISQFGKQQVPDTATMIDRAGLFGISKFSELSKDANDLVAQGGIIYAPYNNELNVNKIYEDSKVVSFGTFSMDYRGGAHPNSSFTGATFVKSDGKQLGYDIFKDTASKEFRNVLINGLKLYFGVKTHAQLIDYLLDIKSVKQIPLPKAAPIFTENGIKLIYGQYEIASYAAGMPTIIIPYDVAKDLLNNPSEVF